MKLDASNCKRLRAPPRDRLISSHVATEADTGEEIGDSEGIEDSVVDTVEGSTEEEEEVDTEAGVVVMEVEEEDTEVEAVLEVATEVGKVTTGAVHTEVMEGHMEAEMTEDLGAETEAGGQEVVKVDRDPLPHRTSKKT